MTGWRHVVGQDGAEALFLFDAGRVVEVIMVVPPRWPQLGDARAPAPEHVVQRRPPSGVRVRTLGAVSWTGW